MSEFFDPESPSETANDSPVYERTFADRLRAAGAAVARVHRRNVKFLTEGVGGVISRSGKRGLTIKLIMGALLTSLAFLFYNTWTQYQAESFALREGQASSLSAIPSMVPLVWRGIGLFLALVAFLISLWVREEASAGGRRGTLVTISLWVAAVAALVSWLPADVIATKEAISGKALGGETPSIPAYLGQLVLITAVLMSLPAAAMVYFRLSLMDRYVVHSFLSPFAFCLFSFIGVWLIADFTDNGPAFTGLPFSRMVEFYIVQVPYVILFVLPIAVLLSGLSALSKLSKSNELISMIGAGRSVFRILTPIFIIGVYCSLIGLAFKYEWAPVSVGYKEALVDTAFKESWAKRQGQEVYKDVWAKRGWMHVNSVDRRTWYVGRVPYTLSDPMSGIVVWQLRENGQPEKIWKAQRAEWHWDAQPAEWVLTDAQVYEYDQGQIPRISTFPELRISDWSETPWKVLSSSQDPEFLGVPGLVMYMNANDDMDKTSLAPFRTNFWYIGAEPFACLAMILVAAPLGIVYSRRGVMGGVAGAIIIFALMYVMRGTFLALGHRGTFPPLIAAWGTNFAVAALGCVLLWFRAQNREIPKVSSLFRSGIGRIFPGQKAA
ncbi:MAG: LptF/LptG family permease [Verrucomicrobiales bacterium]|nr:LptF/LptG family permease [Verrucomicrobiales bacterium]